MSSAQTQQLEQEVAALANRLTSVQVRMDVERQAWKQSCKPGKSGTKWKSAKPHPSAVLVNALTEQVDTKPMPVEDILIPKVLSDLSPSYWDSLELAQCLHVNGFTALAQFMISEQISGKRLLETPPYSIQQLYKRTVTSHEVDWKSFVALSSHLRQLDKEAQGKLSVRSNKSSASDNEVKVKTPHTRRSIQPKSPRRIVPSERAQAELRVFSTTAKDDTTGSRAHIGHRKPSAGNGQTTVTCWTCGTQFRRLKHGSMNSLKPKKNEMMRFYCSAVCRKSMEGNNFSIKPFMSAHPEPIPTKCSMSNPIPSPRVSVSTSLSIDRSNRKAQSLSASGLQVVSSTSARMHESQKPQPPENQIKVRSSRARRKLMSVPSSVQLSVSGGLQLPAISNSTNMSAPTSFCQSTLKLDATLDPTRRVCFRDCFYLPNELSTGSRKHNGKRNLLTFISFLDIKTTFKMSLINRQWFSLLHRSSTSDLIWKTHLARIWKRSAADEALLKSIGLLNEEERPSFQLMKVTRRLAKTCLDNMKVLVHPETWQLAEQMHKEVKLYSLNGERMQVSHRSVALEAYERITVIYSTRGEIIGIQARNLIRSVDETALLTDIIDGLKSRTLFTVDCRRLRLFSRSNRLSFDDWHLLPHCRPVVQFFLPAPASTLMPVWHKRILKRMQRDLQKRLLGKSSIEELVRMAEEQEEASKLLLYLENLLLGPSRGQHS